MNKTLQEIKSVQGVTGVLVLDKKEGVTYQLTPASFPTEGLKEIGLRLSRLVKLSSTELSLELRFENGIAFFYNLDRGAILIFGRPGINLPILNLVLKSAFLAIERKLTKREEPHTDEEKKGSFLLDKIYLEHLLLALNQIAKTYKQKLGTYLVTQNLRRSKEKFLLKFSLLQNFFVDNNGNVSIIQGKEEEDLPFDSIKAFAVWISFFIHLCSSHNPELLTDIRELTKELEENLDQMGFYEAYEKLKKT
jgi:hypothetical protein